MKTLSKTMAAAAALLALAVVPASAAPGSPGKATCDIYGVSASGGACVKFSRTGELNGSAFVQNCRALTGGVYPFTFYPEGPLPTRVASNLGECKAALRFYHSLELGP